MSLPSNVYHHHLYQLHKGKTSWSLDAHHPIQTYITMNRSSQWDIKEYGATVEKNREAATIQERESGNKWETRIIGTRHMVFQWHYRLRAKNKDAISWERYPITSLPPLPSLFPLLWQSRISSCRIAVWGKNIVTTVFFPQTTVRQLGLLDCRDPPCLPFVFLPSPSNVSADMI